MNQVSSASLLTSMHFKFVTAFGTSKKGIFACLQPAFSPPPPFTVLIDSVNQGWACSLCVSPPALCIPLFYHEHDSHPLAEPKCLKHRGWLLLSLRVSPDIELVPDPSLIQCTQVCMYSFVCAYGNALTAISVINYFICSCCCCCLFYIPALVTPPFFSFQFLPPLSIYPYPIHSPSISV